MPRALITGIAGQDGSYLAELLLSKGYEVSGLVRQLDIETSEHLASFANDITLIMGDLLDQSSLLDAVQASQPDELYNLAAQSQVHTSFERPVQTADVNALGVARLLEVIREVDPTIRMFQASTSEIFGAADETPQGEATPLHPRNPYGVAKVYAHLLTANVRESHGLHVSSGILFNHESPRRGREFVTRKITHAVAQIHRGQATELRLGNLDARRDWGYAGDFAEAMWLMLQQDEPDDYVIATGVTHSVREFCDAAFAYVGLDYRDFVSLDERYERAPEPQQLVGDPTKARTVLGWQPRTGFDELVAMMVDADLARSGLAERPQS